MASGDRLLILADRARAKPETASPYDLWLVVKDMAGNSPTRIVDTRHAFIHAGYLRAADGEPYTVCPDCGATLPVDVAAAA